jgi:hypothetical protein
LPSASRRWGDARREQGRVWCTTCCSSPHHGKSDEGATSLVWSVIEAGSLRRPPPAGLVVLENSVCVCVFRGLGGARVRRDRVSDMQDWLDVIGRQWTDQLQPMQEIGVHTTGLDVSPTLLLGITCFNTEDQKMGLERAVLSVAHRSNLGDVDPRTDTGVSTSEHSRDEWPIWAALGSHKDTSLRACPNESVSVCLDVVAIAAMPASQIGLHVHAPASLTRGAFVEPAYEIS